MTKPLFTASELTALRRPVVRNRTTDLVPVHLGVLRSLDLAAPAAPAVVVTRGKPERRGEQEDGADAAEKKTVKGIGTGKEYAVDAPGSDNPEAVIDPATGRKTRVLEVKGDVQLGFDEEDHPRDESGRFASGGGGGGGKLDKDNGPPGISLRDKDNQDLVGASEATLRKAHEEARAAERNSHTHVIRGNDVEKHAAIRDKAATRAKAAAEELKLYDDGSDAPKAKGIGTGKSYDDIGERPDHLKNGATAMLDGERVKVTAVQPNRSEVYVVGEDGKRKAAALVALSPVDGLANKGFKNYVQKPDGSREEFNTLDTFKSLAKSHGYVVKESVHPSGEGTHYVAQDKEGNHRGSWSLDFSEEEHPRDEHGRFTNAGNVPVGSTVEHDGQEYEKMGSTSDGLIKLKSKDGRTVKLDPKEPVAKISGGQKPGAQSDDIGERPAHLKDGATVMFNGEQVKVTSQQPNPSQVYVVGADGKRQVASLNALSPVKPSTRSLQDLSPDEKSRMTFPGKDSLLKAAGVTKEDGKGPPKGMTSEELLTRPGQSHISVSRDDKGAITRTKVTREEDGTLSRKPWGEAEEKAHHDEFWKKHNDEVEAKHAKPSDPTDSQSPIAEGGSDPEQSPEQRRDAARADAAGSQPKMPKGYKYGGVADNEKDMGVKSDKTYHKLVNEKTGETSYAHDEQLANMHARQANDDKHTGHYRAKLGRALEGRGYQLEESRDDGKHVVRENSTGKRSIVTDAQAERLTRGKPASAYDPIYRGKVPGTKANADQANALVKARSQLGGAQHPSTVHPTKLKTFTKADVGTIQKAEVALKAKGYTLEGPKPVKPGEPAKYVVRDQAGKRSIVNAAQVGRLAQGLPANEYDETYRGKVGAEKKPRAAKPKAARKPHDKSVHVAKHVTENIVKEGVKTAFELARRKKEKKEGQE